jgi:hypothetical protein
MLQAAAGNATGGAGLNVEDVFSTYLYTGNDSTQTITNGIDLDGEGGFAWFKLRNPASDHSIFMTDFGNTSRIIPNETLGLLTGEGGVSSFNSDGFSLNANASTNGLNNPMASWTFRKAPKFFDVVTYTGNGLSSNNINHNLGSVPAFIIVKRTDSSSDWWVVARTGDNLYKTDLRLNQTSIGPNSGTFSAASLGNTDTYFNPRSVAGDSTLTNASGATYVAYLFAHNDGDGEFGPDGDADIIKCGSYTSNSGGEITVDLGFEPQWILLKNTAGRNAGWIILDTMRGFSTDAGNNLQLLANASYAELDVDEAGAPQPTATGFKLASSGQYAEYNYGTDEIIYIAIRRGTKVPESATEVFAPVFHNDDSSEINVSGGFTADAFISKRRSGTDTYMTPRLLGGQTLRPSSTAAEIGYSNFVSWDTQEGVNFTGWWGSVTDGIDWQWKRAPGFFDAVAYTGDGVAGRTVSHNLGAAPEMMWVKKRSGTSSGWLTYDSFNGATKYTRISATSAASTSSAFWNDTEPTSSVFSLGTNAGVNGSGETYIAYLFASLAGVSKVGSFTGNGTSQTIDCGFTNGARFVLIKRPNDLDNWYLFDTARGITAGNDPILKLNATDPEDAFGGADILDPHSSGFTINYEGSVLGLNSSGVEHIFYAIA